MSALALLSTILMLQSPATGKLEIKDVKVGTGPAVKSGDYVTVDYTGKLLNGKKFDSSIGREPFSFIVGAGQVIKGWDQGLVGAKVGTKRMLTIPAAMGYGSQDMGDIPPNSVLKFEIDVKKIQTEKIEVLKKGTGPACKGLENVEVHYVGKFQDGKKFDASRDHGQPMPVQIGRTQLVPGFTMGILGMKVGEKRKVTIPPALGYGKDGRPPVIPANSTLVFELELMKINK